MRKRVRIVMFIVAAAFIAGFLMSELWRMLGTRGSRRPRNPQGYVGQVGDHMVTPDEYRAAVSYMTDKYKRETNLRDLSNEDYRLVEQQAWGYLVNQLAWARLLKAENIHITQDEALEIMQANPPAELRNRPELMTDGKFDPRKYLQLMNAPENRQYFIRYFQQILDMVPKEKFRLDVVNAYRLTNAEVEDGLSNANTRWKTTALYFGPQALKEKYEPTDSQARVWYEAHKKDYYRTKETWQLRYVVFPLKVTRADSEAAKETIDRAYDQLQKGESFNLTMLDYSDYQGESLSTWTPRSQLDPATDTIVSKLKPGQYSKPFLARYGWQIAMLDSIKPESVAARRIVVRLTTGPEELATVRDSARSFLEKTASRKFDTVAAEFGLTAYKAPPLFSGQQELTRLNIERPTQVIDWAKTAKPGQVFDQPQSGPGGYYVFELDTVRPAGFQDFDERAKAAAIFRMRLDWQKEHWLAMADTALAAIKAGQSLEQYAEGRPGIELQTDSFTGITSCRRRQGPEFAGALEALDSGETCGPVETNWGVFIVRCDQRTSVGALTASDYANDRRDAVVKNLTQDLLKEPEVKDFREAMAY